LFASSRASRRTSRVNLTDIVKAGDTIIVPERYF
jgi:hypothetical protein